jgi:hypothetical protein
MASLAGGSEAAPAYDQFASEYPNLEAKMQGKKTPQAADAR